jgi:arylsulfatase A-like enzyme
MKYNRGQRAPRTVVKFANIVRRQDADCFSCADLQIDQILEQFKNTADTNSTIILYRGDHGWDLRDARKHTLVKEPDTHHSSLIIHTQTLTIFVNL